MDYNYQNPTGRLARWAMKLSAHDMKVIHRKGAINHVPDALSRMFEDEEDKVTPLDMPIPSNENWYTKRISRVQKTPYKYKR